jgi:hypothetical protein
VLNKPVWNNKVPTLMRPELGMKGFGSGATSFFHPANVQQHQILRIAPDSGRVTDLVKIRVVVRFFPSICYSLPKLAGSIPFIGSPDRQF